MEHRKPVIGQPVVYVDPVRVQHSAIVTAVWGAKCINLVFVSSDENKTDTYGRQIDRQTSCNHMSAHEAPGNYWRHVDEQGKATEL
jgi:hypothetical protein